MKMEPIVSSKMLAIRTQTPGNYPKRNKLQVPNSFDLTVSFKFLNFSFQICLLYVPKMSPSITSYIVEIIYIALAWVMYPLHFSMLPRI